MKKQITEKQSATNSSRQRPCHSSGKPTKHKIPLLLCSCALMPLCICLYGCTEMGGYSNSPLYPQDIRSVRVEMFDNKTFRRGVEYELSDALAKRIEADTPYKIVSSKDRADTVMTGQIVSINESVLTLDRQIGRALEKEVEVQAVVNWKNLKTGELLIGHRIVTATATYSAYQSQDFNYASSLAANNLAQKIVELMEKSW